MEDRLAAKVAIVTGASSGIGKAMAAALIHAGSKVALAARNAGKLEALAEKLGPNAYPIPTDVTSDEDVSAMVERTIAHFGSIDILFANAGVYTSGAFAEIAPQKIAEVLRVNLEGVMRCAHAVLPHMRKNRAGDILIVGSIAGASELRDEALYSASKFGLQTFARILPRQVCAEGIRVGIISPGTVATELWGITEQAEIDRRVKQHDALTAEDVANTSMFMLSQPAHITIRDLVILSQAQDI